MRIKRVRIGKLGLGSHKLEYRESIRKSDYDAALEQINKYLHKPGNENNYDAHYHKAVVYYSQGNYNYFEQQINILRDLGSQSHPLYHFYLGNVLTAYGKKLNDEAAPGEHPGDTFLTEATRQYDYANKAEQNYRRDDAQESGYGKKPENFGNRLEVVSQYQLMDPRRQRLDRNRIKDNCAQALGFLRDYDGVIRESKHLRTLQSYQNSTMASRAQERFAHAYFYCIWGVHFYNDDSLRNERASLLKRAGFIPSIINHPVPNADGILRKYPEFPVNHQAFGIQVATILFQRQVKSAWHIKKDSHYNRLAACIADVCTQERVELNTDDDAIALRNLIYLRLQPFIARDEKGVVKCTFREKDLKATHNAQIMQPIVSAISDFKVAKNQRIERDPDRPRNNGLWVDRTVSQEGRARLLEYVE